MAFTSLRIFSYSSLLRDVFVERIPWWIPSHWWHPTGLLVSFQNRLRWALTFPLRGGGTPRKNWVRVYGMRPASQNPYPVHDQSLLFYLLSLWPDQKFDILICARYSWQSFPKHNLWRVIVYGLIDDDNKVAPSKKHTQSKTKVQKPYPIYDQNGQNRHPFLIKTDKNRTLRGLYSPCKGVPPRGDFPHPTIPIISCADNGE